MRKEIIGLYKKADINGYAIGAFNFSTNEILKGIWQAALKMKSPIIISNSEGERSFFGCEECVAAYNVIRKRHSQVILHADHTKTFKEIKRVIDAGFPSVHFDGSELDYETNLRETKRAADYAHKHDVFIEGELGGIRGGSTRHGNESLRDVAKEEFFTNPKQAEEFVKKTGIDSLAVSVGNAHGIWKEQKKLDFSRIIDIKSRTGKFLVLHGGSGIPARDFRKAIALGVNKININTELRLAYEDSLIHGLHDRTDDVPYHYLGKVSEEVGKVVEEKIIIFGSEKKSLI
ncbi:MAG: class II fructose-bisphosphate aldolase [archaeon]